MDKGIGTRQRDPDHGDRLKLFRQGIHTGDHRDPECRFHTRGCESQDDKCLQEVSERPEDDQGLLRKEDHSGSQKSSKDEGGSCVDQSVVQCETGSKSRRDGPERNGDDPEYDAFGDRRRVLRAAECQGHRDREYDGGAEHGTQNDTAQHDDGWVIRHGGCHVVAAHIETETCSGDDRRIGTDRSEERSYKF